MPEATIHPSESSPKLEHKTEKQELAYIRLAKRHIKGRVYGAETLVKKAFRDLDLGDLAVCWSGGRCSTAVLHMALKICPDVKVLWVNHGVHYPETVRYVREMTRRWDLNLFEQTPERTFWDIVKEHGFPLTRRPMSKDKKVKSRGKPACCKILKIDPMKQFLKDSETKAIITGLRVSEARVRMLAIVKKGAQHYFTIRDKVYKYHPIILWTTKELHEYCIANDIPLNPLYKKIDRTGCWPCTSFFGWRESLGKANPKLLAYLEKKMGEQGLLDHHYRARVKKGCRS